MDNDVKSNPPSRNPIGGMRISLTREVTIFVNDVPMITPMAIATTLPFATKSLNSFRNCFVIVVRNIL
jgi:hypothetical protein